MAAERPGVLVCVGGSPGAGKTTLGRLVASAAAMALVDLDSVTTPLVEALAAGLGVAPDLDAPGFAVLRAARYACLAAVAADNLGAGRDVVVVAPFTAEASDAVAWRATGASWGARRVVLCWLDVDPAEAARRVAARALPRDRAKAGREAGAGEGGGRAPGIPVVDRNRIDVVLDGRANAQVSCAAVLAAV